MPLYELDGIGPTIADPARFYLAPGAQVIGNVHIGLDVSIWFGVVIRADNDVIELGDGCNIQDNAVVHADPGTPARIGAGCTVGHRAIVHGATIGANSLVGMGSTILNDAVIGEESLVGANALVTEGKVFEPRSLIVGAPAKAIRVLDEAGVAGLRRSAASYVANGRRFGAGLRRTGA